MSAVSREPTDRSKEAEEEEAEFLQAQVASAPHARTAGVADGQDRNLAEWDAEIEADFRRVVAATERPRKLRRHRQMIGCPWGFVVDVCSRTRGRSSLLVALYIYRRTKVCRSATVTLIGSELAELGVRRERKRQALATLQAAKLIRFKTRPGNHSMEVTMLWQPAS